MKGPFYTKDGNKDFRLMNYCKNCAFITNDGDDKDATCFMNPCPCAPLFEEEEEKEDE